MSARRDPTSPVSSRGTTVVAVHGEAIGLGLAESELLR